MGRRPANESLEAAKTCQRLCRAFLQIVKTCYYYTNAVSFSTKYEERSKQGIGSQH
ncbi:hypothetical protein TERTU_3130 [Teredinibacter turnerae T7901]|uniref:Uncharacterized protein n=1 Tax=Teredinibacter turnerae (strain ATCC 39867 / T7901) TaxID=377629 RepID=C5BPA5_TERTT|nr:hypothetical protein TERTU_3130 [Teredinibacter turnerae T7901]